MWHRQSRNPTYSAANGQKWSRVDYLSGNPTTGPHSESAERASSVKAAQHDRLSGSLPGPSATPASTQAVPAPRKTEAPGSAELSAASPAYPMSRGIS